MTKEGEGVIGLQAGTNKYASQSNAGVVMGGLRHAADIRADDMTKVTDSLTHSRCCSV